MSKRVLLIDNDNVSTQLETIIEKAKDSSYQYEVECFHFNPVERRFEDDKRNIDHDKAREAIISEYLGDKLDVVGCDFNLDAENKTLTFDLIKTIREYNKSCTIFIYSGAPLRELAKIFQDKGKNPGEKLWQLTIVSNISGYVNNKTTIPENVIELLNKPSVELLIEDFLLENSSMKISHGYSAFNGKQLFEIAEEIRLQSKLGKTYVKEIIDRGLSHMIDLNSLD